MKVESENTDKIGQSFPQNMISWESSPDVFSKMSIVQIPVFIYTLM